MDRGRIIDCWNCDSRVPLAEFKGGRCPVCGVRPCSPPLFVALGLAFGGALVGWLGGACLGVVLWLLPGGADVMHIATWGSLVGALGFGWVGLCLAVLFAIMRAAARRDPEILERAATIRRLRAEAAAGPAEEEAGPPDGSDW
jgi:hypothetical protein